MINNAGHEADMLRRAAEACRNVRNQQGGTREWFEWVEKHLANLADRLEDDTA